MASYRERRKPFVRTRSPTPPWLRDWKGDHRSDRAPLREPPPERYREYDDYRPKRPSVNNVSNESPRSKVYGPWTGTSDKTSSRYGHDSIRGGNHREEGRQWRGDSYYKEQFKPQAADDGGGHGSEGYMEKRVDPLMNPLVVNRGVQNVVSQLVDLVTSKAAAAAAGSGTFSQDLPFSNQILKQENTEDEEDDFSGDFCSDDLGTSGLQFVGVSSRSLEQKEIRMRRGLYCSICDVAMPCIDQYQKHLIGVRHRKMLKRRGLDDELGTPSQARISTGLVPIDSSVKKLQCIVCGEVCESNSLAPHVMEQKHLNMEKKWSLLKKPLPRFIDMFVEKGSIPVVPMSSDAPYCKACDIMVSSYEELVQHNQGKKHLKMVNKKESEHLYCKVCDVYTTSEVGLQDHYNGKKHAMRVLKLKDKETETGDEQTPIFSCDVCTVVFCSDEELKEHFAKDEHFSNIRKKAMEIKTANPLPFSLLQPSPSLPQQPQANLSTLRTHTAAYPAQLYPVPSYVQYPVRHQVYYPSLNNNRF